MALVGCECARVSSAHGIVACRREAVDAPRAITDMRLFHAGAVSPRGVTMRDRSKNRAGFDRVLMAVAATFLTVSATSALAQADPARSSAAELAIDAAIPRPEPANLPPPTINDFKLDATATGARRGEVTRKPKPRYRHRSGRQIPAKNDTATTTPASASGCGHHNAIS